MRYSFSTYVFFFFLLSFQIVSAQRNFDILHYEINISLSDSSDLIDVEAILDIDLLPDTRTIVLDLTEQDNDGKGMKVSEVKRGSYKLEFTHKDDKLTIQVPASLKLQSLPLHIAYSGIPKDGLIISRNKYGSRTFFGDNWPNRAHNWIPCVDHPSEKATVGFNIICPDHYQAIANGTQIEETNLNNNRKLYAWETEVEISTKVMVIGVAEFATQYIGEVNDIPVYTWVYPQNKTEGFYDYYLAKRVLSFFMENVGPYPFSKLANVQSTTRFGGMENASNIFYSESSVTGQRDHEELLAHEIAHQWFGNSASEIDWAHLWLSEGFATYLTDLYVEHSQGQDAMRKRLKEEREKVINFAQRQLKPVIDSSVTDYMQLLNANSYQKGAWVLHMLRNKVGNETFWEIIRTYYHQYKFSNASSKDFEAVAERVSGENLTSFFNQWLRGKGHPKIEVEWGLDGMNQDWSLSISQAPNAVFSFPLEIEVTYDDGSKRIYEVKANEDHQTIAYSSTDPPGLTPVDVRLDPNVKLLFEGSVKKR